MEKTRKLSLKRKITITDNTEAKKQPDSKTLHTSGCNSKTDKAISIANESVSKQLSTNLQGVSEIQGDNTVR